MIRIIVTGSIPKEYTKLMEDYIQKMQPFAKVELLQKKEVRLRKDGSNLENKLKTETEAALAQAKGEVILLDPLGKSYTSEALARFIEKRKNQGQQLSFIIGGSHGFYRPMVKDLPSMRLSDLTMLHHMAALFLSEALYRSFKIISRGTYHK